LNGSQSLWRRLAATKNLSDLGREYQSQVDSTDDVAQKSRMSQFALEIQDIISNIKKTETNVQLLETYEQF